MKKFNKTTTALLTRNGAAAPVSNTLAQPSEFKFAIIVEKNTFREDVGRGVLVVSLRKQLLSKCDKTKSLGEIER